MAGRYWVVVTSRDHALNGAELGIMQVNHGKEGPLKRMSEGDRVLIYAPKLIYKNKESYQRFVALAEIVDEVIFQVEVFPDFRPFRRKAKYLDINEVAIEPLIPKLDFIKNKKSWGYSFRFGFFEIGVQDFNLISSSMGK